MDTLYREEILEHYKYPRNKGTLEKPDITYKDFNPLCGDECQIDLHVKDNRVDEVKFMAKGCAISQAATSMLTEMIEGKSLEEIKQLSKKDILDVLGIELGPVRLKCALLCLKVLKGGIYGIKEWPT
ncbi:MAG: SUF system NifU family Fe-S cluster assembly protein [Deltaproteobacteria bacterium RIFCSPLOWO2_01_44_7]|nr:MAG: SUF system NifU family Fe-S cluster assembly protein [Deltaproteobacteria bacterium RIFCSPHIGHO2_01_FULL_43_49]OGQ14477.1 MAG: SUF system NifU family Fe-S cluster assembly protein [Deltaproteobacteria bacterium RIFCSPHIGHO2_02_FULL_44_53]OGQ27858.1 MAG: SUF system NifU family Fe-S cluster assembly protein [Deltaproteobacteria bacterium RIFCSPHIGHO2_12_FULL_44_21]OGQ30934.1 MAG: SUF system NifU family Fe-S cluster assembly protein [Deltaproteobacteria bacterium RIFCSPLOWO2_01_FULL_45_74]